MPRKYVDSDVNLNDTYKIVEPKIGSPLAITSQKNITVEHLDAMINNPKEHPEIRMNAKKMKDAYFSGYSNENVSDSIHQEEKISIEQTTVSSKTPKKMKDVFSDQKNVLDIKKISTKSTDDLDFNKIINKITGELYTQTVHLLSDPSVEFSLKSMTVSDYKFLSKQLEVFYNSYTSDDVNDISKRKESEENLTYALDTVLSRCIVGNISVYDISIFDWIYILLYLRCISRGQKCTFNMSKKDSEKGERVEVDLYELLDHLERNKSKFSLDCFHIESLEDMKIVMMPMTRGDMKFATHFCSLPENKDASLPLTNLAMTIKGVIINEEMYLLSMNQRIEFLSGLNYDMMEKLSEAYSQHDKVFKNTINAFFEEKHPNYEALKLSDFIYSFYVI